MVLEVPFRSLLTSARRRAADKVRAVLKSVTDMFKIRNFWFQG